MAGPELFQFLGNTLDAATATYVTATSSTIIANFRPIAITVTALYFTLIGYLIVIGQVQQPVKSFWLTVAKTVFVGAFALNVDTYTHWVVSGLQGLEVGITEAFSGSTGGSVYAVVDETLEKGGGLAVDVWKRSGDTFNPGRAIGETLIALVIAGSTLIMVIPAGAMIVVAKFWLTVSLGIGPFFLMCALWPATRQFFDRWIAMVMNHIFVIALNGTVLLLAMKTFAVTVEGMDINGEEQSTLFIAMTLVIVAVVMGLLLKHTGNVAAQLSGGISDAAITFSQMAGATRQVINPTSSRLDPRTGMQTTSSRLEHAAMGRSLFAWSPAYRAGVKERFQKAWSRKKDPIITGGGKT